MKQSNTFLVLSLFAIALSGTACSSDDSGPQVDRQTAELVVREITSRVQVDLASYQGADANGEVTLDCSGGGTVSADGEVNVDSEPVRVDVNLAMAYAGCTTASGYAIDGDLTFSQHVLVGGEDTALNVETVLAGAASLTRDDEVHDCAFDLNVVVTSSGTLVKVEGSACGHPADTFELAITPHW